MMRGREQKKHWFRKGGERDGKRNVSAIERESDE